VQLSLQRKKLMPRIMDQEEREHKRELRRARRWKIFGWGLFLSWCIITIILIFVHLSPSLSQILWLCWKIEFIAGLIVGLFMLL
jgi:hypothetical protein